MKNEKLRKSPIDPPTAEMMLFKSYRKYSSLTNTFDVATVMKILNETQANFRMQ